MLRIAYITPAVSWLKPKRFSSHDPAMNGGAISRSNQQITPAFRLGENNINTLLALALIADSDDNADIGKYFSEWSFLRNINE